jgi:prepilin-type processing-associated H-X9-DG protein
MEHSRWAAAQRPRVPVGAPPRQGLAVGALICGIAGLAMCPVVGIVGLILGIVALARASNRPDEYGGKGFAIGGICTGGLSLLVIPLMIAILLPALSRAREMAKRVVCTANMQMIHTAMQNYAQQYGKPAADLDTLVAKGFITPQQLTCPSSNATPGSPQTSYVWVGALSANPRSDDVLLYERRENHQEGANVLFGDGHVQFVTPYSRVEELVRRTRERAASPAAAPDR